MRRIRWGAAAVVGTALVAWLIVPWPIAYRWKDPEVTSFMRYRERQAEADGTPLEIRNTWVPLGEISPVVVRAVIEAEDGRFREHHGVDWVALGEEVEYAGEPPFSWFDSDDLEALSSAVRFGWNHRDEVRGRSTITQQLAKNLYFTPDRSLVRKVAEVLVAQRLEWFLSKDRILELYLNSVELGPGIFGVEEAAQEYFGMSSKNLGAWEAASLAATLPHPLTSNPAYRPARMAWRRDLILERLTGSGDASPIPPAPPDLEPPPLPMDP